MPNDGIKTQSGGVATKDGERDQPLASSVGAGGDGPEVTRERNPGPLCRRDPARTLLGRDPADKESHQRSRSPCTSGADSG